MRMMVVAESPENLATECTFSPKSVLAASRLFPSIQVAIFIAAIRSQKGRPTAFTQLDGLLRRDQSPSLKRDRHIHPSVISISAVGRPAAGPTKLDGPPTETDRPWAKSPSAGNHSADRGRLKRQGRPAAATPPLDGPARSADEIRGGTRRPANVPPFGPGEKRRPRSPVEGFHCAAPFGGAGNLGRAAGSRSTAFLADGFPVPLRAVFKAAAAAPTN